MREQKKVQCHVWKSQEKVRAGTLSKGVNMRTILPAILIVLSAFFKCFDDERDPEDLHL